MKKARKPKEAGKALMRRFTALILGAWLLTMWLLTYATAKDFLFQMYHQAETYAHTNYGIGNSRYDIEIPGVTEAALIDSMGFHHHHLNANKLFPFARQHKPSGYGSDDWFWGKWDLIYNYEAAEVYYSEEEELYLDSGSYITFAYTSEQSWRAQKPQTQGFAYMDLDSVEECREALGKIITPWPHGDPNVGWAYIHVMRLMGYFEENLFVPVSVYAGSYYPIAPQEHELEYTPELYSNLDARGKVEWRELYTVPNLPDRELETVYSCDLTGITTDFNPVTVNGVSFDGLPDLLESQIKNGGNYEKQNLWDAVFIHRSNKDLRVNGEYIGNYHYAIAVRCWPMGYAALRLLPTYVVTLVAAFVLIRLLRRRITRSLVTPLERAITGIDQCLPMEPWHEPQTLMDRMRESKEAIHDAATENQQLRTALDYARDAEEKRRRLVSDLTHELKTPLAIIHGYAEGLKSGIAQEKKERYLDVILEESERMDAMVLQMLDLSRLEAGKVKLSADRFSLLELVKNTVEKFSLAIEEKELQVHFLRADAFDITADESRITQVVTNLVSNAVKYADPGGNIRIWIYKYREGIRFEIENTAPLLTDEALEKVFDSFYRTDPSRSEPGTGLGLAIVKGIVQLHGGKCIVRNKKYTNETCVEFSVALPAD